MTLAENAAVMILSILRFREELDEDVVAALEASLRRYLLPSSNVDFARGPSDVPSVSKGVFTRLSKRGRDVEVELLQKYIGTTDVG